MPKEAMENCSELFCNESLFLGLTSNSVSFMFDGAVTIFHKESEEKTYISVCYSLH